MMFPGLRQSAVSGVNNFPTVRIPVINVTASALVQYGVYQLDLAQSDGDVTTIDLALSSVIAVATTGIACGMLCVVQSAIAAGGQGQAVISGVTKVITDNSAIIKGSALKAANATHKVALATTGTDRFHLQALEVNGSVDATTILALMFAPFGTR